MIAIRDGQVLTLHGWQTTDVLIDGDRITSVAPGLSATTEIDAKGFLVGPGFVDMHTHLREPGYTWKEDIASGSSAAAAGGFTAITAMPNTDPPMDSPKVVELVLAIANEVNKVDVIPSGALTAGRAGATPSDIEEMYRLGVRLFTDDGDSVADSAVLEDAMRIIAELHGAFVAQHAEDSTLTVGGHMHEGSLSRRLGIGGLPAEAESRVVERDLALVARTGGRYHCQHVSAKMTVELIRTAKEAGLPVTAEVTPHHLTFDDSYVAHLDPDFKMYPPLRSEEDRTALVEALRDGTIDVVATDHAPHSPDEKGGPFADAPRGVIGLETAASATWEALQDEDRLFAALSIAPGRLLGLEAQGSCLNEGKIANVVVFDPEASWVPESFESKASNSPFRGRKMKGRVRATIHRGRLVYQSGDEST